MAAIKFRPQCVKCVILKHISMIDILCISCEITSRGMNVMGPHWRWVSIGLGNGLVPSGMKPLPEPMLTKYLGAIWHPQGPMS